MNCPYCGNTLKEGIIDSNGSISFQYDKKELFLKRENFINSFVSKKAQLTAFYCEKCNKIIIDLEKNNESSK